MTAHTLPLNRAVSEEVLEWLQGDNDCEGPPVVEGPVEDDRLNTDTFLMALVQHVRCVH